MYVLREVNKQTFQTGVRINEHFVDGNIVLIGQHRSTRYCFEAVTSVHTYTHTHACPQRLQYTSALVINVNTTKLEFIQNVAVRAQS